MSDKGYERYLHNMLKQEHAMSHGLVIQLQQQRNKNNKLLQQITALRKKQNDNKIRIKEMQERINELEMELQARKGQNVKKIQIQRINTNLRNKESLENQSGSIDRKEIFKQFINDNYPKYKQTAKKTLAFILHIEKHAAKNPKQRIDAYYEIMGSWIKRFLVFVLGKKNEIQKKDYIAEKMIEKWKNSDGKMKQLMAQRNQYKAKQDKYLEQIEKLEANQARIMANRKAMQAKIFSYQNALQLKGAQFVVHLKRLLTTPDQISEEDKKRVEKVIQTMTEVSQLKANKQISRKTQDEKQESKLKFTQTEKLLPETMKQGRPSSSIKVRKNAPVLKKNIFGYYQNPQFSNNQPNLSLTKHPNLHKNIQTVPEDLSVITTYPVIKLTIIDGNIKPNRNRHNINFYVKLNYNKEQKLQLTTKVSESFDPVWNEEFLIYGYSFPFFTLDVMNQAKGLRDNSIGDGRIQVTRTQKQKWVSIKNQGQYQGKVRFMITYPKGRIYMLVINSVKLAYPQSYPMGKDTLNIKVSLNPNFAVLFQIGQIIKYFDDDYKGNNRFLILDGYDGEIKTSFEKTNKKGSIPLFQIAKKQGQKQIQILLDKQWSVILSGVLLLLISEQDEPQAITQETDDTSVHKYFSLLAPNQITSVEYNSLSLPSHIKMPLVFRFTETVNFLKIYKKNQEESNRNSVKKSNKKSKTIKEQEPLLQQIQISPIVIPGTNVVCQQHKQQYPNNSKKLLKAPTTVYEIKIQMVEGNEPVKMKSGQYFYEKILQDIQLICGDKQFSIPGKDLLQNFYIIISRTFKDIGYTKFKIGYAIHTNLLKDRPEEGQNRVEKIIDKELDVIDNGQYYLNCELNTGYFSQYSSTADYTVQFLFGNCSKSSKKTGNLLEWKECFILPINKQISVKIYQYSMLGDKCIYQSSFIISQVDLKLKCKFVMFGKKFQNFIFFNNLLPIKTDLYSLKVNKIEGQLLQNTDWIGQMDPYIKFITMNRTIYTTQKLDGAEVKPVWHNDQFVALTQYNFINLQLFDDDLVGKDDYLGECTLNISDDPTKTLQGTIKKYKQPQKQCGKLVVHGQFGKMKNVSYYQIKQSKMDLPELIYKITFYKIQINNQQFNDSDIGYISYQPPLSRIKYPIKSNKLQRKQDSTHLEVDYSIWLKQFNQNSEDVVIDLYKIVKNMFTSKQQHFASVTINKKSIIQSKILTLSNQSIALKGNEKNIGYIGTIHYIIEPVQVTRLVYIEALASQNKENLVLVSDNGDCIVLDGEKEQRKLLAYDQKWYALTEQEYTKYNVMDKNEEIEKVVNFCQYESKYQINRYTNDVDLSNMNVKMNNIIHIENRNEKQREKLYRTPNDVLLIHEVEYQRRSHPVASSSLATDSKKDIQLYRLNHLTLKCTSSNKQLITQNTLVYIIIKWQDYQLKIPTYNTGISNFNIPQKLLQVYSNIPRSIQIVQYVTQGYKQYQNHTTILTKKFSSQIKSISNYTNKQVYTYQLTYIGEYFKYKGNGMILSCEFMKINQMYVQENFKVVEIPWIYLQLPAVNMNDVNVMEGVNKKEKYGIKQDYELVHQVEIEVGIQRQPQQNINELKQTIQSTIILNIPKQNILIPGRCVKTQPFSLYLSSKPKLSILNTQLSENPHKFEPYQYYPSYFLTNLGYRFVIMKEFKRNKQLSVIQYIKKINLLDMDLSNKPYTANPNKNINRNEYICTNKYHNMDHITIYSQILTYPHKYLQYDNKIVMPVSSKCMLSLQELIVDINDNISSYNVDKHQLYIRIVNTKSESVRIFRLELVDRQKKKYKLRTNPDEANTNRLMIDNPEDQTYRIEIWAQGKSDIFNKIINSQNKLMLGSSICVYDKWETCNIQTAVLQLKQNKQNDGYQMSKGVISGNDKSIGYIKLKYRAETLNDNDSIYKQNGIDRVVLQLSGDKNLNLTDKIRFECRTNNNSLTFQQVNQQMPFYIFYANLSTNSSNKFLYEMSQNILLSLPPTINNKWPFSYQIDIYNDKYNTLLGSINSTELQIQNIPIQQQQNQLSNISCYRWSKCIEVGNLPQAILSGSSHKTKLLNSVINNRQVKHQKTKQASMPSQLEIEDKIGQTIVQFSISNLYGMIQPAEGELIHILIQTSQRVIRNTPIKYYNPHRNKKKDKKYEQFVYSVYMYHKQLYNSPIVISICSNKGQPMYSSVILPQQIAEIGYSVFYNPQQIQGNASKEKRMPCGSCIYTISLPPYNNDVNKLDMFIEISNIQVEVYQDSELFSQMTPYLIINNRYSTNIGLGKDDLFWKLALLLPISSSISTSIQFKIKDKDMFFDDYIGNSVIVVQPFDIKAQMEGNLREKMQNTQHKILRIGQYTHVSEDIKNNSKLAGRIRVQYRYVPVLPVVMLIHMYKTPSNPSIELGVQQVYKKLTKNRHKDDLNLTQIVIQIIQLRITKQNIQQFIQNNRELIFHKESISNESKANNKIIDVNVNGIELQCIGRQTIQQLGVTTCNNNVNMYTVTGYKSASSNNTTDDYIHKWKLTQPNSKNKPNLVPISNNSSINNLQSFPFLSLYPNVTQFIYLSSFSIFIQKSKLNTTEYVQIYILTSKCAITLVNNINAKFSIHGQGKYSQVINIEIDKDVVLIPMSICGQMEENEGDIDMGEMKIIIYDKQTGYSCSVTSNINKIINKDGHADQKYKNRRQRLKQQALLSQQIIFSNKYTTYSQDPNIKYNEYLILSKLYTTNKYQLEEQYKQDIGVAYIKVSIIYRDQLDYKIEDKYKQNLQIMRNSIPIPLPSFNSNTNIMMVKIKIMKAIFIKDIQLFGKMDPYCQVYLKPKGVQKYKRGINNRIYRTQVKQNIGKLPQWNEQFYINIPHNINDNQMLLEWVVNDEQMTLDRLIGYAQFNISQYVQNILKKQNSYREYNGDIVLSLCQKQNKQSNHTGDLYINVSLPVNRYVMFTHFRMHNMYSYTDSNIEVYYQKYKQREEKIEEEIDIDKIPDYTMIKINTGNLYPLSNDIEHIKMYVKCQKVNKVYTGVISTNEMYEKLYRGEGKLIMIEACLEIGYTLCQQNWDAEKKINEEQTVNRGWYNLIEKQKVQTANYKPHNEGQQEGYNQIQSEINENSVSSLKLQSVLKKKGRKLQKRPSKTEKK